MMLALLLCGLIGTSVADLGYHDPPGGTCLCTTARVLNIRDRAGLSGTIIGRAKSGECYTYTNALEIKSGYRWYRIDYSGTPAWAAGKYLITAPRTDCNGGGGEALPLGDTCGGRPFDQHCLDCICKIESGCRPVGCAWDVNSESCGYLQIKKVYYDECKKPGRDYKSCANNRYCSATCLRNYMDRYYGYCTGSSGPKCCEEVARIHNGGPRGCKKWATKKYWDKVRRCLDNRKRALPDQS